jgi:hypothetical protein
MFFSFTSSSDAKMVAQGMPDTLMNALRSDRESLLRADAFRSLIFIVLAGGFLWLYIKNKLKMGYIISALAILIIVDMWPIAKRSLNDSDFKSKSIVKNDFVPTVADNEILKDKDPNYRVLNINSPFTEVHTSYFHKSIGGYHAAKLRKYQELADTCMYSEIQTIVNALSNKPTDSSITAALKKIPALNMLNARYIIYNPDAPPLINKFALGNAWFVKDIKIAASSDEELQSVNKIDPSRIAVIGKKFENDISSFKFNSDSTATINFVKYKPNFLEYHTKSAKDQLAVFSEIYYPNGWNAYIDGKPTTYFRANYILRAMIVPAGEHKIEFKFEPKTLFTVQTTAMASSIIVIILVFAIAFVEIRKRLYPKENEK